MRTPGFVRAGRFGLSRLAPAIAAGWVVAACSHATAPRQPEPAPPDLLEEGVASWYGSAFDGRTTASGEAYDSSELTAAHPCLPFGTRVRVINTDNGREVVVRINDRGPRVRGRIIDVSRAAADALGMRRAGTARVRLILVNEMPPPDCP